MAQGIALFLHTDQWTHLYKTKHKLAKLMNLDFSVIAVGLTSLGNIILSKETFVVSRGKWIKV